MYHAIVRRKLYQAFDQLNRGDYDSILKPFAPRFEHFFSGEHALGGTRHTMDACQRWYDRLARVFPDLRFRVRRVIVTGWPWDTQAIVEWTDHATVRGQPYSNEGVHVFRLRWGRLVELHIYCDTAKLIDGLNGQAEHGISEAVAGPIND